MTLTKKLAWYNHETHGDSVLTTVLVFTVSIIAILNVWDGINERMIKITMDVLLLYIHVVSF